MVCNPFTSVTDKSKNDQFLDNWGYKFSYSKHTNCLQLSQIRNPSVINVKIQDLIYLI